MSFSLEDLVDIDHLQKLFDSFYAASGIAASVLSPKGDILIGTGFQSICTDFHRKIPESEKLCIQSETSVYRDLANDAGRLINQCPHGLIKAAIPIVINNEHVANLFTGQYLLKKPDADTIEKFRNQARQWDFNEKAYLKALSSVPIISKKRVNAILQYLKQLAEMIGELGFSHLKLKNRKKAVVESHSTLKEEITRRKEETQKLSQIIEGNPIPIFVIDSACKITHWNHACEMLTGSPASQMIGTDKHREVFYPERRPVMADLMVKNADAEELDRLYGDKYRKSALLSGGYEGEDFFPRLGKEGEWLFFTAAPIKDANGTILGAIETLQNVTKYRAAQQKLLASEAKYRQLFESANDAIFLMKDQVIVDCNKKACDLFNSSREELIGLSAEELSPATQPDGKPSADEIVNKRETVERNMHLFVDWRLMRKDASTFDAEVSLTRFKVYDSPHTLAIIRDVTQRKKIIQTLQLREKELDEKTSYLEKVNQALKASLDHREVEKRAIEENMLVHLKRFVLPYLDELDKSKINTDGKAYVNIIRTNLDDVVSQLSRTLSAKYLDLTPTEIRVTDLIREGKNSKEIAQMLNLSPSSVQWHRKNIRVKLGLTNKKVNLHTYLNSLAA